MITEISKIYCYFMYLLMLMVSQTTSILKNTILIIKISSSFPDLFLVVIISCL